jgi:hypothetical protein
MDATPQQRTWAKRRDIVGLVVFAGLITWSGMSLANQSLLSGFILVVWLIGPVGLLASVWFVIRRWRSSYRPTDRESRMQEFGTLLAVGALSTFAATSNLGVAIGDHDNPKIWMSAAWLAGAIGLGVLGIIRVQRWRVSRGNHPGVVGER